MVDIVIDDKSAVKDSFGALRIVERSGEVPASTASDSTVGLVRFQKGAKINDFVLEAEALDSGTDVTLKVGFIYDDTSLTSNDDAFFTALDIAQTGGGFAAWPADSNSLNVTGFEAEGAGYLAVTIDVQATEVAGDLTCRASLSYGD